MIKQIFREIPSLERRYKSCQSLTFHRKGTSLVKTVCCFLRHYHQGEVGFCALCYHFFEHFREEKQYSRILEAFLSENTNRQEQSLEDDLETSLMLLTIKTNFLSLK